MTHRFPRIYVGVYFECASVWRENFMHGRVLGNVVQLFHRVANSKSLKGRFDASKQSKSLVFIQVRDDLYKYIKSNEGIPYCLFEQVHVQYAYACPPLCVRVSVCVCVCSPSRVCVNNVRTYVYHFANSIKPIW